MLTPCAASQPELSLEPGGAQGWAQWGPSAVSLGCGLASPLCLLQGIDNREDATNPLQRVLGVRVFVV